LYNASGIIIELRNHPTVVPDPDPNPGPDLNPGPDPNPDPSK